MVPGGVQMVPGGVQVAPRTVQMTPGGMLVQAPNGTPLAEGAAPAEAPSGGADVAQEASGQATGEEAAEEAPGYGPTPLLKVRILHNFLRSLCGKCPVQDPPKEKKEDPCAPKKDDPCAPPKKDDPCAPPKKEDPCAAKKPDPCAPKVDNPCGICDDKKDNPCCCCDPKKTGAGWVVAGWLDFDYTYRSTGPGNNAVAPVMNHFGDEFLNRQDGILISKLTDPKTWSWGFNMIFIAGSDASFLNPTQGWFTSADLGPGGSSRFSAQFTDLNIALHAPILTEGGIDFKLGRQTTVLGPMGALPWQRWFDSSDYAWYNMEEGRYTGVSATWHITKRLDWYNGFELGWGTFYDQIPGSDVDYITQISYWLDPDAKKVKVWTTVLTGPTSLHSGANTTTFEYGALINWDERWYQIIDTQMVYSKGPVNAPVPPGYLERAYDVYTYLGYHLDRCWDLQSRFEWYKDVDGKAYAGGFGVPHTDYYAITVGPDYHPVSWIQIRPEARYDYATHPNFGEHYDKKNQLSLAAEVLFKF